MRSKSEMKRLESFEYLRNNAAEILTKYGTKGYIALHGNKVVEYSPSGQNIFELRQQKKYQDKEIVIHNLEAMMYVFAEKRI